MNQYGAFAHSYDRMMHDVDYPAWGAYLDAFLREAGARTVLDCACGTGRITLELAARGYSMTGADLSEEMLMEARNNALQSGKRFIPFVCQNMTQLSVHRPMDAIVCACDGVNYLTDPEEISAFLKSAYGCLKSGGMLLFDISSAYKLETVLGNETFTETADDYAYIWNNAFDPETRLCEMDLTFFVREGERYRRFSEQHIQRAHTVPELLEQLRRNGFTDIRVYDAFTRNPVLPDSERIQFTAKKEAL